MRSIHIIFLLLLHNSGAALTGITEKRSNRAPSSEVINYYFEHGFNKTLKGLFLKAAKAWENYTCVRFEEKRGKNFVDLSWD
ncbi:hypothetical protein Y032_0010g887 [Ancylostoma ceylanicum]|nr:hypothetical protein Y032_0010g887 [Ancylostoma ceylanicum]